MQMPSMNYMSAELACNRDNTSCFNSVNGNKTRNTEDISYSACPPIVSPSIVSLPESSACGSSPALNRAMMKTSDTSAAALTTQSVSHDVDPPAGVDNRVRAVRRIENTISRQVTFCKRRTRLFKKAYELAMLCNAEVAVIAFSCTGRMHHYASSSMSHIVERYRDWRSCNGLTTDLSVQDGQFWRHEAFRLRQRIKHLTDLHGYLNGENLSVLPFSGIRTIETSLEAALYKTKLRKMELLQLLDQTTAQKSFLRMQEENELLKCKLAEVTAIGHGSNKSSTTITPASSRTNFESNAQLMTSCQAAHTSDDDNCQTVILELGL